MCMKKLFVLLLSIAVFTACSGLPADLPESCIPTGETMANFPEKLMFPDVVIVSSAPVTAEEVAGTLGKEGVRATFCVKAGLDEVKTWFDKQFPGATFYEHEGSYGWYTGTEMVSVGLEEIFDKYMKFSVRQQVF